MSSIRWWGSRSESRNSANRPEVPANKTGRLIKGLMAQNKPTKEIAQLISMSAEEITAFIKANPTEAAVRATNQPDVDTNETEAPVQTEELPVTRAGVQTEQPSTEAGTWTTVKKTSAPIKVTCNNQHNKEEANKVDQNRFAILG